MEAGHPPVGEWMDHGPSTQQSANQHGKETLGEETTACCQVNEAALKGCDPSSLPPQFHPPAKDEDAYMGFVAI